MRNFVLKDGEWFAVTNARGSYEAVLPAPVDARYASDFDFAQVEGEWVATLNQTSRDARLAAESAGANADMVLEKRRAERAAGNEVIDQLRAMLNIGGLTPAQSAEFFRVFASPAWLLQTGGLNDAKALLDNWSLGPDTMGLVTQDEIDQVVALIQVKINEVESRYPGA